MVKFNKKKTKFVVVFDGDQEEYMNYVRSLSRVIAAQDKAMMNHESLYYATTLLGAMLPDSNQSVIIL